MFAAASLAMSQPALPEPYHSLPGTTEPTLWQWLIAAEPKRFMLPLTGLWILGIDWLIFTKNMLLTLGVGTPLAVAAGFLLGSAGSFFIQRRFAKESVGSAAVKAILAGMVVGVPFPLAGSAVGSWILIASGLNSVKDRLTRK